MISNETITKTILQYSEPLPDETMEILRGIAGDYRKVKNYTYSRYSGIRSLNKLTPVYTVLNEMRYCGLRQQLNLPAVYYELAVSDAVADIKSRWELLKHKINELITANENLHGDERKYLRTVLKINSIYAAVLNNQEYEMPENAKGSELEVSRLNNLLRRLTRKYLTVPQAGAADTFRISPAGYSYKNGCFQMVSRVPRKRVPIPMKDKRTFDRQILVQLRKADLVLAVPVETPIRTHPDYTNTVSIYIGNRDMLTLSNGNVYGKFLNERVDPETERLNEKNRQRKKLYTVYRQNTDSGDTKKAIRVEKNNLGTFKYKTQKGKKRAGAITFINAEINRMLSIEKPGKIIITKPVTRNRTKFHSRKANRIVTRSFQGYIRERLKYKCRLHSIELVEISSGKTGSVCSVCGAEGQRLAQGFICPVCGWETSISLNSAKNIQNKYNQEVTMYAPENK